MRRLIPLFFISFFLFLVLVILASQPTAAQEPDSPPLKGSELTPLAPNLGLTPQLPPFQIDRSLLPRIEPQLLKKLLTTKGESIPFVVYLKEKTDTAAVVASISSGIGTQTEPDSLTKRTAIVNALQQTARNTQSEVLQILRTPSSGTGLNGQNIATTDIKPLWIVNAVAARGSLETVLTLAAHPDVEIVRLDRTIKISRPPTPDSQFMNLNLQFPQRPNQQAVEWGINKIRADLVHNALGIDGSGVVVANIDSGVDWSHPALQAKYRGFTGPGNLPQHIRNWFDATGEGALYPTDSNGHGTHTMGTMVGDGGIGVAPGAKWIAVRTFNGSGIAQSSWLHSAFQWILAPNGNPALAPDIVNNSWGNNNGFDTEFEADVQALLNAGIYPVFSAGNAGPSSGTVGSPGSLNNAFSVGATTIDDEIALFSSRGPSPWGKIKPEVSAPGKSVRSSLPGGTYGYFDGTSMAAPHTAGLAALLIQASPALANNLSEISNKIRSTAVDLGPPGPDNSYGAGRIDAFNAVISVASAGVLQGAITDATTNAPISDPLVQITSLSLSGSTVNINGDSNGAYSQGLAPDTYNVTASAFGYNPLTVKFIDITTNTVTIQNFSLTPKPTGYLVGAVKDKVSNAPLAATIKIEGTPVSTPTNPADGSYSLELPVGVYTATVIAAQHRITKAINITINNGAVVTRNFLLDSAPSILLVDSGRWYQESQISYYQQALDDALYPYDTWQITKPFDIPNDIPSAATLSGYDIVIWSSPLDSPGFIGADDEIEAFLNGGGKLLLSGQDIAYYDDFWFIPVNYLKDLLKASFVQDDSGDDTISGVAGEPFDGTSLTISSGDGANNQILPDVIANADADFAGPLLAYDSNNLAGLHVGLCLPYRAIFFSFGFEAINSQTDRHQVMQQTIDWLMETPAQTGVDLTPENETLVGNFGANVSHTIKIRNTGTTSDTFNLSMTNGTPYNWPTSAIPASVLLNSCQSQELTVNVQVPAAKIWHISDTFTVTAQSGKSGITDIATRSSKTPAPVLLVDDDRWFSFAAQMKEGLEANNIPHDYWFVAKSFNGPLPPSPPLETLQMYPMVVWYVAYDWFQPLLPAEEDRLMTYLDGGGRLFFSGQDFLYNDLLNHGGSYATFAQDYLGVQAHTEDFSSTLTIGQPGSLVGSHLGPYPLTFPALYNNWTDALTPTATARIATLGQEDQPNSLTNAGVGPGGDHWHTVFLAYGPELLASNDRARLMQRSVGWLSWLGSSTVEPQADSVANGALITYSASITNDGLGPISTAYFTATFPSYLAPVSASPGVNLAGGEFIWNGPLAPNQGKSFTYTAQIVGSFPPGSVLSQTSWLAYNEHNILFDRVADVNIAPDLSSSSKSVTPNQDVKKDDVLAYTIVLKNDGLIDAPVVTTTDTLPSMLDFTAIDPPSSGTVISSSRTLTWTTPLAKGQVATLTFRARVNSASGSSINNVAFVDDGINKTLSLSAQATFKIQPLYLPIIFKN